MEYLKNLMFWRKEEEIEEILSQGLDEEQKRKYRKQYISLAYNVFIISLVYILGIISFIGLLFSNGSIWTIALVVILLRDYEKMTIEWRREVELIKERIEKRIKKNRKQRGE